MQKPTPPRLTLHYGSSSSARTISHDHIANDVSTTMTYDQTITIRALPGTDLWRKPPSIDVDNAPTFLISSPIDIHKFQSARVTVSANWNTLFDQGGLVLFIPDENTTKWIKMGIEYFVRGPHVMTVGTTRWSDASVIPLGKEKGGKLTVQVEREVEDGQKLECLLVYIIDEETGEKIAIREVNWWFRHDILDQENSKVTLDSEDNRRLLIGVYAARPTVPAGEGREEEELVVTLERFQVKLFDD